MPPHFRIRRRTSYPWFFISFAIIANSLAYLLLSPAKPFELFILITGAIAGFIHFLYKQHHQETQLFVSLFNKFNERYDALNEKLNAIVSRDKSTLLSSDHTKTLFDYFNLCAEEHLYFESGYIDKEVWEAWLKGMHYFYKDEHIRNLWAKEISEGSYYRFKLKLIEEVSNQTRSNID
ncbi:hypothetical protein ACO0K3_12215 [Undibacterium sp. Rencai35W]|uniref:hypothetical protein n=1 Tax=Undibacterium sp. Rencai35W TaxID=3413046 RepID=UPI003BF224F1